MSNIDESYKIRIKKPIGLEEVKRFIREKLDAVCIYKVDSEEANSLNISGKVKENVFTYMTKFSARFALKMEDDVLKVNVGGNSTANWVFWVFIIIGLFTGIFIVIAIVLYLMQRNKPAETINKIMKAVENEYS